MAKITEYPVTTEIANDDVLLVDGAGGTRGLSVSGFSEAVANNIVNSTAITGLVADIKADIQEKGDEVIDSIPSDYTALQGEVSDLKSDLNDVEKIVNWKIELSTLDQVKPLVVNAGDKVSVYAKDGSTITVQRLKLRRANGTDDYWTIANTSSRTITATEDFVGVFLSGGTAQTLVIETTSSYLNFQPAIDAINNIVSENTNDIETIKDTVGIIEPNVTWNSGSYINRNGVVTQSSSFRLSEPIQVYANDKIRFYGRGYETNVAMISTCDSTGNNIHVEVISDGNETHDYTYTAENNGYVIFSNGVYNTEAKVTIFRTQNALEEKEIVPDVISGYIHRDCRIMTSDNFQRTNPIRIENSIISFDARGYSNTVSLLCSCDENGENRETIFTSTDSSTVHLSYKVDGVAYFIISSSVAVPIRYKLTSILTFDDFDMVSLSVFSKFGVIGDSFASGTLYFDSTYKYDYPHSWPQILAHKLGTTATNYTKGGLSTRTWLTDSMGLPLLLASEPDDIYYLALGINDEYALGLSYLGSITDITSHSSYSEYPDTFYGNYGKIIEQIQGHAPHAKIVMFTMAHNTSNAVAFNAAIIEIANHYGLPYITERDDPFFTSGFFWNNMVEGHPIAITYSGMACAIERLLVNCIKNNVAYFKNLFCYNE